MSTIEKPYGRRDRPGHTITRRTKGDPRKRARQERAAERLAAKKSLFHDLDLTKSSPLTDEILARAIKDA